MLLSTTEISDEECCQMDEIDTEAPAHHHRTATYMSYRSPKFDDVSACPLLRMSCDAGASGIVRYSDETSTSGAYREPIYLKCAIDRRRWIGEYSGRIVVAFYCFDPCMFFSTNTWPFRWYISFSVAPRIHRFDWKFGLNFFTIDHAFIRIRKKKILKCTRER